MSSGTKRQSVAAPSGPKPPATLSSSLTISKDAALVGTHSITMQAETVIHPRARFDSTLGSILIGRRCVIQERAHLGIRPQDLQSASAGGVSVGDYVIIEVGSQIETGGTEIGEGTVIQIGSKIGSGAKIGKVCLTMLDDIDLILTAQQNCTITPRSTVAPGEILPDQTVVYSNGQRRTDRRRILEARKVALLKQINVVRKMIRSDPDKFR